MAEGGLGFALICVLVLGPMAWRAVYDRRRERALAVAAHVRHVVDRTLGGESLISIQAEPATLWRAGRVILSIPADWRWLLKPTWDRVLATLPAGYELVVQQREAPARPAVACRHEHKAAA